MNDVFDFIPPISVFKTPEQYSMSERSKAESLRNVSYRSAARRLLCILLVIRGWVMMTPFVNIL